MWFWWTLTLLLLATLSLLTIALLAPLTLSGSFHYPSEGRVSHFTFHFFNKWVLSVSIRFPGGVTAVILGKVHQSIFNGYSSPEPVDSSEFSPQPERLKTEKTSIGIAKDRSEPLESPSNPSDRVETPSSSGRKGIRPSIGRVTGHIDEFMSYPAIRVLKEKRTRDRLGAWVKRILVAAARLVSLRHLDMQITGGTDDPATTGKIFGLIATLQFVLSPKRGSLRMHPVFTGRYLALKGELEITSSLGRWVGLAAVLLFTFPYFSVYRVWRSAGKQNRPSKSPN